MIVKHVYQLKHIQLTKHMYLLNTKYIPRELCRTVEFIILNILSHMTITSQQPK